jgi:hypothetical protein
MATKHRQASLGPRRQRAEVPPAKRPWRRAGGPDGFDDTGLLIDPADIGPEAMVRVVPLGLGSPAMPSIEPVVRDEQGRPLPRPGIRTDWACFPPGDLYDSLLGPEIFCSRRFVDALLEVGAHGWEAVPVQHFTSHVPAGHEHYLLTVQAFAGSFAPQTKLEKVAGRDEPGFGVAGTPVGIPKLADEGADFDHIAWTDWVHAETSRPWRGLLVSGAVVAALVRRSTELSVAFQPVDVSRPAGTATSLPAGRFQPATRRMTSVSVAAALAKLRTEPGTVLFPAPDAGTWAERVARRLGSVPPLVELYRECNGGTFLDGVLTLLPLEPVEEDLPTIDEARAAWDDPPRTDPMPRDAILFATKADHTMFWVCDPAGTVSGYTLEGEVHGPGAPFGDWLDDQLTDIRFVADNQDSVPGAMMYLN